MFGGCHKLAFSQQDIDIKEEMLNFIGRSSTDEAPVPAVGQEDWASATNTNGHTVGLPSEDEEDW